MSDLSDRVIQTAKSLILAAGAAHAVAATDISSQARGLAQNYSNYSANQIANQISDEIKKTHSPGVSGSV